ncbi:hypothetical protein [Aureimonas psammosilenae]|uniref:hypothetical protein n=1 Tax=Aureimonas psammosilenae TaxID=2495496 RepID=UPI001260F7D4|nr:hypothetical protein [Aureimonas psammosilenae]
MTNTEDQSPAAEPVKPAHMAADHSPAGRRSFLKGRLGAAAVGALVLGVAIGGAGTAIIGNHHQRSTLVLEPAAISSLQNDSLAAVKAQVAEVFGNKIVVEDGSGRVLIETGPEGEGRSLAAKGDTITAQGRFDEGVLRAEMLVQSNGKVVELKPKPPRDHPPRGPKELALR